jgi:hypothetical protein
MRRAKERRPFHLPAYRNMPMDAVLALLTASDEDYFIQCHGSMQRRRR